MKFKAGDTFPSITLESVSGESIKLPDPDRFVHLQLRRFVDCPICNTHIAELRKRAREIGSARSEEHTSELQSRRDLVCRLLLEKKKRIQRQRLEAGHK